jgi:hypothetical protein
MREIAEGAMQAQKSKSPGAKSATGAPGRSPILKIRPAAWLPWYVTQLDSSIGEYPLGLGFAAVG